jgi:putative transposase
MVIRASENIRLRLKESTLKKSRFSEEQIVRILNEVSSGKSVREVWRAHGVSENSYYVWERKYGGMDTDDVRRLKELEAENAALKRIVANQAIELEATGKLLRKNGFRPPSGGRGPSS